jgi:transposase
MSEQKRRRFTAEFKIEAVRLVKEEGLSEARVAQDLGVRVDTLQSWIKTAEGRAGLKAKDIFPGNGRFPRWRRSSGVCGARTRFCGRSVRS